MKQKISDKKQSDVTAFYDMVFPSHSSDIRYPKLLEKYDYKEGQRIGDFGCGGGLFKEHFCNLKKQGISSFHVDISFKALSLLRGKRVITDIQIPGFKNGAFHLILLIGVLHHLPDMQLALKELYRILEQNGCVIVGVYKKWSFPAFLRKLHDRIGISSLSKLIRLLTYHSIRLKLIVKGAISKEDWEIQKRVRDLLDTPIVRYWSKNKYMELFRKNNLVVFDVENISSMRIFFLKKVESK